jgi:hypothetical protein
MPFRTFNPFETDKIASIEQDVLDRIQTQLNLNSPITTRDYYFIIEGITFDLLGLYKKFRTESDVNNLIVQSVVEKISMERTQKLSLTTTNETAVNPSLLAVASYSPVFKINELDQNVILKTPFTWANNNNNKYVPDTNSYYLNDSFRNVSLPFSTQSTKSQPGHFNVSFFKLLVLAAPVVVIALALLKAYRNSVNALITPQPVELPVELPFELKDTSTHEVVETALNSFAETEPKTTTLIDIDIDVERILENHTTLDAETNQAAEAELNTPTRIDIDVESISDNQTTLDTETAETESNITIHTDIESIPDDQTTPDTETHEVASETAYIIPTDQEMVNNYDDFATNLVNNSCNHEMGSTPESDHKYLRLEPVRKELAKLKSMREKLIEYNNLHPDALTLNKINSVQNIISSVEDSMKKYIDGSLSLVQLKSNAKDVLSDSSEDKKILNTHREFTEILVNLLAAVLGLGVFYGIAALCKGRLMVFHVPTNTETQANRVGQSIETVSEDELVATNS